MRLILLLTSLGFLTSGCACIERTMSSDHMTSTERLEAAAAQQRSDERHEKAYREHLQAKKDVVDNGGTIEEVVDVWGEPDRVDKRQDKTVAYWYKLDETPVYLIFKDGHAIGHENDVEGARYYEQLKLQKQSVAIQQRAVQQQSDAIEAQRRRDQAQVYQNLANQYRQSQPKTLKCDTYGSGNFAQTNCVEN